MFHNEARGAPLDKTGQAPYEPVHQTASNSIENLGDSKVIRRIRNERHSTDVSCCILCLAFWVYFGVVTYQAFHRGDPRRLYHGFDYKGHLCGVDAGFEDKPLMYWPNPRLMKYPICLGHCPETSEETVFTPSESAEVISQDDASQSRVVKIVQTQKAVATYPSKPMAGRFCVPTSTHGYLKHFSSSVVNEELGNPVGQVKQGAGDLLNAWVLILLMIPFASGMGYCYLFFLKHCAKPLTWTIVFLLFVFFSAVAFFCWRIAEGNDVEEAQDLLGQYTDEPMKYIKIIGWSALALDVLLLLCIACLCRMIERILGCVEASCDAIWALPILLPLPIVEILLKLLFFVVWAILFAWVVSSGELQTKSAEYGDVEVHGWKRHFTYTRADQIAIAIYIFALFWGIETITAMIHFVISYGVAIWYFTPCLNDGEYSKPHVPQIVGFDAFRKACRYHLGSLTLGAGIVALFRFLYVLLEFIAKNAQSTGNPIAEKLAHCCMCCVWCFEEVVKYINKNAIIQIVLTSEDFFTAAGSAIKLLAGAAPEVAGLNGITAIFQVLGVTSITSVCAYFTYLLLNSGALIVYSDVDSEYYIEEPMVVIVAAGIIGFVVSLCYMLVFDMVSDTLIFCWITDREDGEAEFAPKPLREQWGHPKRGS